MSIRLLPLVGAVLLSGAGGAVSARAPQEKELTAVLAQQGLVVDRERGFVTLPANVQIKNELLEYILVAPNGAAHESLFLTKVRASVLNTALLLLGVEPGRNARWIDLEPSADGHPQRRIEPPQGDGFFIYVAWREGEEVYFFRLEDLIRNFMTGRSLRRHRFVYLGSRFAALNQNTEETFVAEATGNLINLAFFFRGDTLLTGALEECNEQTIWAANEWLLPPTGAEVRLIFARQALAGLPADLVLGLPLVQESAPKAPDENPPR
jgi:hypothetical protein